MPSNFNRPPSRRTADDSSSRAARRRVPEQTYTPRASGRIPVHSGFEGTERISRGNAGNRTYTERVTTGNSRNNTGTERLFTGNTGNPGRAERSVTGNGRNNVGFQRTTTENSRNNSSFQRNTSESSRNNADFQRNISGNSRSNSGSQRAPERDSKNNSGSRRNPTRNGGKNNRNTGRNSGNSSRNYRKSRYYRQQRQRRIILAGTGFLLLLLLLIFSVRSCKNSRSDLSEKGASSSGDAQAASGTENNESAENSQENAGGGDSSTADGEPSEDTAAPAEPITLTVSVVGDCTLGTDENFGYDSSLNAYFDSYGKDYFLENVRDIFSGDDLTIANMEGTLTTSGNRQDKQFAFKAPQEFAGILSGSSVEAVNMANNHSHDYGDDGFSDTLAALDDAGIVHFGYEETAVMDIKGVKVGLVGIYELNDHLGCADQLKTNIQKVKDEGAVLTIVIFHWGNEKEQLPDSNQTTLGRMAVDEGADLVCGHHPHVLQGIEEYNGKNIVYSLGNFCFGGNSAPSDTDTMIFQQTFTIDENGVKADNVTNIIPCSISSAYGYNNYQPTPAEGDEKERIMQKIQERSSWISTS